MRLLHDLAKIHATYDDPGLAPWAGLVPLGSFLPGNALQLGKVHRLLLAELARLTPLLPSSPSQCR